MTPGCRQAGASLHLGTEVRSAMQDKSHRSAGGDEAPEDQGTPATQGGKRGTQTQTENSWPHSGRDNSHLVLDLRAEERRRRQELAEECGKDSSRMGSAIVQGPRLLGHDSSSWLLVAGDLLASGGQGNQNDGRWGGQTVRSAGTPPLLLGLTLCPKPVASLTLLYENPSWRKCAEGAAGNILERDALGLGRLSCCYCCGEEPM